MKATKHLRFVPVALGAACTVCMVAVLGGVTGAASRIPWLVPLAVLCSVLLAGACVLAAKYHSWYEKGNHALAYEVAAMFTSVFFVGSLGMVGFQAFQNSLEAPGTTAESGMQSTPQNAAEGSPSGASASATTATSATPTATATNVVTAQDAASLLVALDTAQMQALLAPDSPAAARSVPVYFGREGCPGCITFKDSIVPLMAQEGVALLFFDTASASGSTQERQAILDTLDVHTVPVVLVLEGGAVVERITQPASHLGQVLDYAKNAPDPHTIAQETLSQESDTSAEAKQAAQDPSASSSTAANQCDDGDCSA